LPEIMRDPINRPPKSLCLTHYQKNSLSNATSAVYWNARTNGVIDRDRVSFVRGLLRTPVKYIGRSYHVMRARRNNFSTSAIVALLGLSGLAGWWVGRYAGDKESAQKLVLAHPTAALSE
jgi:hypothetical protein